MAITFNHKAELEEVKRYPHFNELNDEEMYRVMRETTKPGFQFKERGGTVYIGDADTQIKEDKIIQRYGKN